MMFCAYIELFYDKRILFLIEFIENNFHL
ncbi:hypothetical protein XBFFR1_900030 [Xenorhabdus bovienii str. feltiae France]|nr:hypothetical protein XBFFR1_900030 [Xenorhabdus bovienii str. feltiae France]